MNDHNAVASETVRELVRGVVRKTAALALIGAAAAAGMQSVLWPQLAVWSAPAGVLCGGALGAANFHWLARAVERVYLRQGTTGPLSTAAAVIINVLKLSAIFVILFVIIKKDLVNIFGLVAGLSLCFLSILWQGFALMTDMRAQR